MQAAKAAISAGQVSTKSGAIVSKSSKMFASDAALFVLSEALGGQKHGIDDDKVQGPSAALAEGDVPSTPRGAPTLTPAGEAARQSALEAVVPVRRRSAASRAAAFQNAKSTEMGTKGNEHGLAGRGNSVGGGSSSSRPKRYSKKSKPGTAAAALGL